nr:MAG TPA: hypothetical protein [Caudoviricetes sp.]
MPPIHRLYFLCFSISPFISSKIFSSTFSIIPLS